MDIATGDFPAQDQISYGQGQVMLATASAARADVPGARATLERLAEFAEGEYMSWPGTNLVTLGEHWMCSAALVTEEVLGSPAGQWICDSYLRNSVVDLPDAGSMINPSAGASGGLAEAVMARAELQRRTSGDRKSTRLNSSHLCASRMPSSA